MLFASAFALGGAGALSSFVRNVGGDGPGVPAGTAAVAPTIAGDPHSGALVPVRDVASDGIVPGSERLSANLSASLTVVVTFRLQNQSGLDALLANLSDPRSESYHRYLSADQFDLDYSPSASVYRSAEQYFASFGPTDLTVLPDRVSLSFEAPVSTVDAALHTEIGTFSYAGRSYLAPTESLSLPGTFGSAVAQVAGVGTAADLGLSPAMGGLRVVRATPDSPSDLPGNAAGGYPSPPTVNGTQYQYASDYQVAYDEQALFGTYGYPTNSSVATILVSGQYLGPTGPTACGYLTDGEDVGPWVPADIYGYFNETLPAGEPHPSVVPVPLDGAGAPGRRASCDSTFAQSENTIDLETIGSMAPGATIYNVYVPYDQFSFSGEDQAFAEILSPSPALSPAVQRGLARVNVISNSWGGIENNDSSWFESLEQAQARGITVLACAGDSDDNDLSEKYWGSTVYAPASMAYSDFGDVAVGGTTVVLNPATLAIECQVAWNVSAQDTADGGPAGSTGGISGLFPEPVWQRETEANAVLHGAGRGVPDLAAAANNTLFTWTDLGYQYRATNASANNLFAWAWGTSIATPLTAGLVAEIDHALATVGRPPLGFLDPSAYSLANRSYAGAHIPTPFWDVTSGSNYRYSALPGYDLVTGWGSIEAANFTTDLLESVSESVTLTESGLPTRTLETHGWTVVLGGKREHSSTATLVFAVSNGSYPLLVTGPSGYATDRSGELSVFGNAVVSVPFSSEPTVTLNFRASGLPRSADPPSWCATVEGFEQCTTRTVVTFANLTRGTYPYDVGSTRAPWDPAVEVRNSEVPNAGSLTLTSSLTVRVAFAQRFALVFAESGLPPGTNWTLSLAGTREATSGSSITFYRPNGTYRYAVDVSGGDGVSPSAGRAVVEGASVTIDVRAYTVAFTERGLPADTPWSVTVRNSAASNVTQPEGTGSTGTVRFYEGNGTIEYRIGAIAGYTDGGSPSRRVRLDGAAVDITVQFQPKGRPAVPLGEGGEPSSTVPAAGTAGPGHESVLAVARIHPSRAAGR